MPPRRYAPREPWSGPEGPDLPDDLRPRESVKTWYQKKIEETL